MTLAYVPSPSQGVWHLGPLPIRAYAFCILAGILVAVWLTRRRWVAGGHNPDDVIDIAIWAVPFGLVGGRLYHLATDPELYFKAGENHWQAIAVWDGGLGIPGAVLLGALGAWIGCRRTKVSLAEFADAMAPGLGFAQAIGRFGNYFNQELYGRATTLPWAIRIDPAHRPADTPDAAFYQPTFFYETLWDSAAALIVIWAGRRFGLRDGRAFALYLAFYAVGRSWIEALRVDHANHIAGLRLNDWMTLIVFLGAVTYLQARRERPARASTGATDGAGEPAPVDPDEMESAHGAAAPGHAAASGTVTVSSATATGQGSDPTGAP